MERNKISENFREPCKTCKMECFAKIVNCFQPLIIFAKRSNFGRVLNTPLRSSTPLRSPKIETVLNDLQGISFHLKRTTDFKNLFRVFLRFLASEMNIKKI